MKVIATLLAVVLLTTSSFAFTMNSYQDQSIATAKGKKPPKPPKPPKHPKKPKEPKKPPCACACAGTTNSVWSCSPTGCSPKDGTPCSAGGLNQSPGAIRPSNQ